MKNQSSKTSYDYNSLSEVKSESQRLRHQALTFFELEYQHLAKVGLKDGQLFMDFGCGPGFFSQALLERLKSLHVLAVDNSLRAEEQIKLADSKSNPGRLIYCMANKLTNQSEFGRMDFAYSRFVFQHLEHPQFIAQMLFESLKPGGTIGILDSDDDLVLYYPALLELKDFMEQAKRRQKELGGDRQVGKKLGHYLKMAGFVEIQVERVDFSSTKIKPEILVPLVLGFKAELLGFHSEAAALSAKIIKDIKEGTFFLNTGVYSVTATKPK